MIDSLIPDRSFARSVAVPPLGSETTVLAPSVEDFFTTRSEWAAQYMRDDVKPADAATMAIYDTHRVMAPAASHYDLLDYSPLNGFFTPKLYSRDAVPSRSYFSSWKRKAASSSFGANFPWPCSSSPNSWISTLIDELGAIADGWNGAGSIGPTTNVVSDIATVFGDVDVQIAEPEIELDDDGSVALIWQSSERSFALTFLGNRKVVGTQSPQSTGYAPWGLPVTAGADVERLLVAAIVS